MRRQATRPERGLRATLRYLGLRFRANVANLPGTPEAVLAAYTVAIFSHGGYWHRHADRPRVTTPKRNVDFWLAKFAANQERDQHKARDLNRLGYRPIVMWECELLAVETAARILKRRLPRKPLVSALSNRSGLAKRLPAS